MLEEWSVKRRIFVYHTLTVLAALVTLLVVSGGVMGWVTHRYQEWSRSAIDDRAEQVPVSYTHLDVYKRQGQHRAMT